MTESLMLFTIGPVSFFINGSRKMRDLYSGSFLLAYITRQTATYLKDQFKIEPQFPRKEQELHIPNRIIAKVPYQDEACLTSIGNELEHYAQEKFREIWKAILDNKGIEESAEMSAQIQQVIEIYWCFEKIAPENDEGDTYGRLIKKMNSIKELRCFQQSNEAAKRKCSLYPGWNAIFYQSDKEEFAPAFFDKEKAVRIDALSDLKDGEMISAFAFMKRALHELELIGYEQEITSVTNTLTQYAVEKSSLTEVEKQNISKEVALFDQKGSSQILLDMQNGQPLDEYLIEFHKSAKDIYRTFIMGNIRIPTYYAFIKFDGDSFGDIYKRISEEKQSILSGQISEFSQKVKTVITGYHGHCVFSGGEDFLGFVPVSELFPALKELRTVFQDTTSPPMAGMQLTFSAGIAIAHIMEPLDDVLNKTMEMEQYAKENNKDSLAIYIIKRSGEQLKWRAKFGDKESTIVSIENALAICKSESIYSLITRLSTLLIKLKAYEKPNKEEIVKTLILQAVDTVPNLNNREGVITFLQEGYQLSKGSVEEYCKFLQVISFLAKEGMQ